MPATDDGVFELTVPGVTPGQRYSYRIDGSMPRPDPASRCQPEGVHGPSEVIDPSRYQWHDAAWRPASRDLVIYELHVGTFTPEGTCAGVTSRLEYLRDLGITAIELMPVADFGGSRNWGYDGVSLYAPSRAYGSPDDLRALVDAAHGLGLAVLLDVVYNHLGPEGAYLPQFYPDYLNASHQTPWGAAVNLDGEGSAPVRRFIFDNALHWIREYHIDGLRLDSTHALVDESPRLFMREFADTVRSGAGRPVLLFAEDFRNLSDIVGTDAESGWGFDGVWADDFHHAIRRIVAGDCHGYYADFTGTAGELARTIRQGWLYTGQHSLYHRCPRGTDPSAIPMHRFVVCLQNHDQIGNRAVGDRLHHAIDEPTWRALSVILQTSPMTPLLFMGQEWAASTPFRYFTDLEPGLGRQVTEGRRLEFRDFPEFADPAAREAIPDPQSAATFESSRLCWNELESPRHARVLELYRALLRLRRGNRALGASDALAGDAFAPDDESLVIVRQGSGGEKWLIAARLRGGGPMDLDRGVSLSEGRSWSVVMTTEDPAFAADPCPPLIDVSAPGRIGFARPGAVILRSGKGSG
jgi:maltooligosyltrehalose trehalohydrolase